MDAPLLEALAGRVDSLERENRWLRRIGGSAIVGLLGLIALGTTALRSPRELTAERFVLNDASGHPRARQGSSATYTRAPWSTTAWTSCPHSRTRRGRCASAKRRC